MSVTSEKIRKSTFSKLQNEIFFTQSVRLAMRVAHLRGEYIFCLGRDWGSMKGYKGMIDRERV